MLICFWELPLKDASAKIQFTISFHLFKMFVLVTDFISRVDKNGKLIYEQIYKHRYRFKFKISVKFFLLMKSRFYVRSFPAEYKIANKNLNNREWVEIVDGNRMFPSLSSLFL